MATQKSLFETQLTLQIEQQIEHLKQELSQGTYVTSDQYHRTCGRIASLRDVLGEMMDAAREKSEQRNR